MPGALLGCGSFRAAACCPSRGGGAERASAMGRDGGGGCAAATAACGAAALFAISANDCHKSALALAVSTSARNMRFSVSSGRCCGLLSGVELFLLLCLQMCGFTCALQIRTIARPVLARRSTIKTRAHYF